MALGINYSRNQSRKQQFQVYVSFAQLALRDGKTRDEFLAGFKPGMATVLTDAWNEAERRATLPPEETFVLMITGVAPAFGRPETFRRTVTARGSKAARAKAAGELRVMMNRKWGDPQVEVLSVDGVSLGVYRAMNGKAVWSAEKENIR